MNRISKPSIAAAVLAAALVTLTPGKASAAENFVLLVSPITGQVAIRSDFSSTVWINQYSITSAAGSLKPPTWNSLKDQLIAGWDETSASATLLSESVASGETSFQTGTGFALGSPFNVFGAQDLVFQYRLAGSATPSFGQVSYGFFTPLPSPVQEPMPCAGDINADNTVNVDDLLAVINAWGPCRRPPCPADIAPAQVGNGTVNVDDLLTVINAWGKCP